MVGRLDGKVAVITGGCSGIGLGTVELFVAEGACVVAADLQDEKGRMLEQRFPDKVRFSRCDVTSDDDLAKTMALAEDSFGGLDILFNNAGHGGTPAGVPELTAEAWDKTFALLVRGPAMGMKHALPLMLKRGGGSIINTASIGPKIQPIPKSGLPEDIAAAALYLASDDSRFVTGTHIVVDGGITVGPRSAWDVNTPSPILAAIERDLQRTLKNRTP